MSLRPCLVLQRRHELPSARPNAVKRPNNGPLPGRIDPHANLSRPEVLPPPRLIMPPADSMTSPTRILPVADASATTHVMPVPRVSWVHPSGGFLGLSLLNGVLRILTLGVYHFWGKTEVRQRIWSAVRIDGEPLDYRGTGAELFRGFLIVFCLLLLPMLAL